VTTQTPVTSTESAPSSPVGRRADSPRGRPRPGALVLDGLATARAQPVATTTAALVVAMVGLVVLLTTGRSAAAERDVVASFDSVGTRLVIVADVGGAGGVADDSVRHVADLAGVTWAFGLGGAQDTADADVGTGATQVPMRALVGALPVDVHVVAGRTPVRPGEVLVGIDAQRALHLPLPVGGLTVDAGTRRAAVVGAVDADGPLSFLDALALRVPDADEHPTVRYLYVLVDDASHASEVADAVRAVIRADDPTALEVQTSDGAIALRDVVAGRVGAAGRQTMAIVLGVGLVLVTVTMLGAVAGRRRDFGRRRALGASRSAVVVLVLVQSACAALVGVAVGTAAGLAVLDATGSALPGARFVAGVAGLAALVALLGAVPPAIAAARRDPVRILRVP